MAYNTSTKRLTLSSFDTNGSASGGTAFSPVNFINFFNINVSTAVSTDANVVKCEKLYNSTGATIQEGSDYYKPWDDSSSTGTPYYLTFNFKDGMYNTYGEDDSAYKYLKEDYYISFFTKKATGLPDNQEDSSIYHLVFTSPSSLGTIMPNDCNTNGTCDLFLGDIYSNTLRISGQTQTEQNVTTASAIIGATFEADVALTETSSDIVGGYLSIPSVSIYQSFLINFDSKYLGNNRLDNEKGIKSEPKVNIISYLIGTTDVTNQVKNDPVCEVSVDNGTLTGNFIELRNNENLRLYLKNATSGITIKSEFTLDYSGINEDDTKQKITAQFPLRDETFTMPADTSITEIGAIIIGSSNISSSNTSTAYSKKNDEKQGSTMYYTSLKSGGALVYNSDDNANIYGAYSQLGINAWNESDTRFPMKTLVTYNTKNINKADTADKMELTITLYRKDHYDNDNYKLPIAQYIDKETMKVYKKAQNNQNVYAANPADDANNLDSYSYTINDPRTEMKCDDETYSIPIDFSVYTGANSGFEEAKENNETYKYYSNYMVKVEIKLYAGNVLLSTDNDHLIYSNAKVYSDWISLS